jgi:hypothetical protein
MVKGTGRNLNMMNKVLVVQIVSRNKSQRNRHKFHDKYKSIKIQSNWDQLFDELLKKEQQETICS